MKKRIPKRFKGQIGYDLYDGVRQYYIIGVDGTLAQLGEKLPKGDDLQARIDRAKISHQKLVKQHDREMKQHKNKL